MNISLETERLTLRPFREEDAADVFAYAQDPVVGPAAGWRPHTSQAESLEIIRMFIKDGDVLAVVERESGKVIGSVGLHVDRTRDDARSRMLGYTLGRPWWGNGYGTELSHAVLAHAFGSMGLEMVTVCHAPVNERSRRVIEKCGFRYEGRMRRSARGVDGTLHDRCWYSLLADEWREHVARRLNDTTMSERIEGEKIILRRPIESDAAFFARWYNEPDVMVKCGFTERTTPEEEISAIRRCAANEDRDWYTITTRDGRILGEAGLLRMFPAWRCTDLSLIIPDPEDRGKGYGTEAMMLMLDRAFRHWNFHRVSIGVVGFNAPALRFYQKMGFKQEGLQEQGYFCNHEFSDFIMMRMLKYEFAPEYVGTPPNN